MDINCLDGIIKENLAAHIDILDVKSWDSNPELTVQSLTQWKYAISDDKTLNKYGLTAYDIGFVNSLTGSTEIKLNEKKLKLYRVGENDASGNTSYDKYDITSYNTGNTRYFYLRGGYLNGFFKLSDYDYQVLPYRYKDGFTFETWLNFTDETYPNLTGKTDGFFLFMGARAENKFITASANTPTLTTTAVTTTDETIKDYTLVNEQLIVENDGQTVFSLTYTPVGNVQVYVNGVAILRGNAPGIGDYYVNGNILYLNNGVPTYYIITVTYLKNILKISANLNVEEDVVNTNYEDGLYDNVIGFRVNEDGKIGYRLINERGIVEEQYSNYPIDAFGWKHIAITYRPYTKINLEDIDCAPIRYGDLKFFVDSRVVFTVKNFKESFYFSKLNESKDRQLGVPYTISWGGGSFGLKHAWFEDPHFLIDETNLFLDGDEGTFTSTSGISSTYNTTISASTLSVYGENYMSNVFFEGQTPIIIEVNKIYEIVVNVYNTGIFLSSSTVGNISIGLSGISENDITVLEKIEYKNIQQDNDWIQIKYKIQTPYTFTSKQANVYVYTDTPGNQFNTQFTLYFDNLKVNKYDFINNIYKKDTTKDNLLIQRAFDGSFWGGIQVLRIYDNALNFNEIYHNYVKEVGRYKSAYPRGGRVISI